MHGTANRAHCALEAWEGGDCMIVHWEVGNCIGSMGGW